VANHKHWPASIIDTGNLTIEDCFQGEMFSDPSGKVCNATEDVSVSGD